MANFLGDWVSEKAHVLTQDSRHGFHFENYLLLDDVAKRSFYVASKPPFVLLSKKEPSSKAY